MKRNNKGFMLVEIIVASTIVVAAMVILYSTFNRLYNGYRTKNTYFNLDATYATKEMIDVMIEQDNINSYINSTFVVNNSGYIINNGECSVDDSGSLIVPAVCLSLRNLYNINEMILVEYDEESMDKIGGVNQTFVDYINYLKKYYNINKTKGEYTYIVLTETIVNGKNYYGSLRVR